MSEAHDYHPGLPGYDALQLLVDGCKECERRSQNPALAIRNFDPDRFVRAIGRARMWELDEIDNMSKAEQPVLEVIAAMMSRLVESWVVLT